MTTVGKPRPNRRCPECPKRLEPAVRHWSRWLLFLAGPICLLALVFLTVAYAPKVSTTDFYQVGASSNFRMFSLSTDLFLINRSNE